MTTESLLHGTTVAVDGQAVLIIGPSGSGKSALALQMIALGAVLVADDRTQLQLDAGRIAASAPASIRGLIEARGVGLIRLPTIASAPLALVVDLEKTETDRLPVPHSHEILRQSLPCLHHADGPHFASSVMLYLRGEPQKVP